MFPHNTGVIRCVIYTRSAAESDNREHTKKQRDECEALIMERASMGWILIETPYNDSCVSGAHLDRPAFKQLLIDAGNGKFDCIVMKDVTRLHRGTMEDYTGHLTDQFSRQGIKLVFVQDERNPSSGALYSLHAFLASYRKCRCK